MKQTIKITESQLRGLISEAVSEVVRESKIYANPLNEDFSGRKAVVAAYINESDIDELFERLVEDGEMSEDEFYSQFSIGYGNEDTVMPNLFRLAEKLGKTPNKPISRQELEHVERGCYDVYEYGEYTVYPADPTILFVKFVS